MKNQSFAYLLLVGFGILSSCVNVTNNSYASDDLYDEANRSVQIAKVQAAKAAKEKKYLDFQDLQEDDAEVIEEEEGLAQRSVVNPNLYESAYQRGLSDGLFNSPYLGYGYRYTPFSYWSPSYSYFVNPYTTFSIGLGFSYYSPYSFYSPYNSLFYDPFYYSPFYSPFGFNSFYRNYNYYGPGGNYTGYSGQYITNDTREKRNFGPRDDRSTNRNSGGNYTNSPRGGNNSYNTQGNNLPRVNTQQTYDAGSSSQQYVAPRRNSNYEYRSAPMDGGSQRNYSAPSPSYSSPSGGSSSGGGGGGGSSRGPR
ncbi:MAG: hypothetical protein KGM03_01465 [Cytophagales bacterium]|nr:hypothetical protein [Cytophagales bacterium]